MQAAGLLSRVLRSAVRPGITKTVPQHFSPPSAPAWPNQLMYNLIHGGAQQQQMRQIFQASHTLQLRHLRASLSRRAQAMLHTPMQISARSFSDSSQTGIAGARQKLRSMLNAPVKASRSMRLAAKNAIGGLYTSMPAQAKGLMDSISRPGAVQKVLSLHFEAFWQRHGNKVIALGVLIAVYGVWRTMFGVASVFVNLSETMAEFGFLALAIAMAAFGVLYLRHLYGINPDAVYRKALVRLNTNAGVLEVMGAPVAGSALRAYVVTGGGLRLKGLALKYRSRRVQMLFPLAGSERRGLVSLEAKKRRGAYIFKLLAVDVPSAAGPEQRLYLEGDERIYARGSVMHELRDPFLNALSLQGAYEMEDEVDDAAAGAAAAQAAREAQACALAAQRTASEPNAKLSSRFTRFTERMWRWMGGATATLARQPQATSMQQKAPA